MHVFVDPDLGLVRENVTPEGQFSDSFEGRLLTPGHAIEAMWFIMALATRRNDKVLLEKAVRITLYTLVLLPLKGGKWKGCFYIPRGLYQCWQTLKLLEDAPHFYSAQ